MSPPHYPSDLSDQEWAILEPLLSSAEKRGRVRRSGRTDTSRTPSSTSSGAGVRGGCCRASIRPGRDGLLPLAASGGSTAGCPEPTTVFARRCANRRDANVIPARR